MDLGLDTHPVQNLNHEKALCPYRTHTLPRKLEHLYTYSKRKILRGLSKRGDRFYQLDRG